MFKIAYIDENAGQLADFEYDAREFVLNDLKVFSEVYPLKPKEKLQDMLDDIFELDIDAIISDFRLNEEYQVEYSGDDLVAAIQNTKNEFPCFIRTSHEDDAIHHSHDVNKIYAKGDDEHSRSDEQLFTRIIAQIEHYRVMMDSLRKEHSELSKKARESELVEQEARRLIELDDKLERMYDAKNMVSSDIKRDALKKFDRIMGQADELIAKLEQELGSRDE